jgi:trk system potassium uptake protein TrkH
MGEKQVSTLSYTVRGRVLVKYFGLLCVVFSAMMAVPLAVSVLLGEYRASVLYAVAVSFLGAAGALLSRTKAPSDIRSNEALVITAGIFIFTSLVATFPMMLDARLSFGDALFEAVSGVTTTGLSALASVRDAPRTFQFVRSWLQWSGGLGIVVLSVALLMRPGLATRRLVGEIGEAEGILGGTRLYSRVALKVYLSLTGLGIAVLLLSGMGWFPAVLHTLSAVSTGGFSPYDGSLSGLTWAQQAAVTAVSFTGAVSLATYYHVISRGWKGLVRDDEVKALLAAALLMTCVLAVLMRFREGFTWMGALRHAPLLAFSAQSTTGFSTLDVSALGPASKLVLIFSMAVGGSVGSTAGGMKILRLLIMLRMVQLTVLRTCLPERAVVEPRIEGQRLESDEIERALLVIALFAIVVAASWVPFVAMGYDPLDSLFEVVSATGTVGLSTGITGPHLPPLLKGVLCADMLMGRLEIVALLVLLYPGTWVGRRAS